MIIFDTLPAQMPLLIQAARKRRPKPTGPLDLPSLAFQVKDHRVDPYKLQRYRQVCRLGPADPGLPLPFLQVLATPLHSAILAHPDFPLPVLGLVHLDNEIHRHRPIDPSERLTLTASLKNGTWKQGLGFFFHILTQVHATSGEEVLTSTLTALVPNRAKKSSPRKSSKTSTPDHASTTSPPTLFSIVETLPPGLGRAYSSIGGDYNPIHLHPLLSKPFGFPKPIIHGMWTLARIWAELASHLPTDRPLTLTTHFKKPVFLPSTIALEAFPPAPSDAATTAHPITYHAFDPRRHQTKIRGQVSLH